MPAKSCIMDKAFELHLTIQYGIGIGCVFYILRPILLKN